MSRSMRTFPSSIAKSTVMVIGSRAPLSCTRTSALDEKAVMSPNILSMAAFIPAWLPPGSWARAPWPTKTPIASRRTNLDVLMISRGSVSLGALEGSDPGSLVVPSIGLCGSAEDHLTTFI